MPNFNEKFKERLKEQAENWVLKHPIDYHWRNHFKIPFGSKEHLEATFIEQQLWYEEQMYVRDLAKRIEVDEDGNVSVKEVENTKELQKDADAMMDNLDALDNITL